MIQHLHRHSSGTSQPAPIAHFFCSRNPAEPERSDSQHILRSLTKQVSLIEEETYLRRPSVEAYEVRRDEASHAGERPAPLTVEECIKLICEIGRTIPFTIIIDALDECSSQQRRIVLDALKEIRQRCRDVVKTFISSRHEEDIAAYLENGEVLEVTSSANDEDLKRFVKVGVESFVKKWSTMHDEPTTVLQQLEKDISKALVTGAKGMWVEAEAHLLRNTSDIKSS